MVWRSGVRGADQGRHQGHHPVPARRGIPLGGSSDDVPEVWPARYHRGVVGEVVLTSGFTRTDGVLECDGVALDRIAADVGTPTYVYSAATIRDRFERLDRALAGVQHRV